MAYLVEQISAIVNDSVKDALGKNTGVTQVDTSDFVSLGKTIANYNAYEGFFNALTNRIAKTVYFVRSYEGRSRSILRDEHEYGAFIQKVYYDMPDAVDNPTWDIPDSAGDYKQTSPFDVEGTIIVHALIYGGKGTWSLEILRPIEQIKSAFLSPADMSVFIDGIYVTIENAYKLEEERLIATAVNTSMATSISGGKVRNLLTEYNTAHSTNLTAKQALESAEFLKYASMEINRTIDNMGIMSTAYNVNGYATFTSKDNMIVEMLSQFASASDMYLQADTFHNELVALPGFERVPFWQSSGKTFDFADCSKIDVKHDDVNEGEAITKEGIICFVHDVENVAAYFGSRRTWEMVNPRSEVVIHGEKAEKGFAIDERANGIVFCIA